MVESYNMSQPEFIRLLGVSKSNFFKIKQTDLEFPKPYKRAAAQPGRVMYRRAEVMAYLESRYQGAA